MSTQSYEFKTEPVFENALRSALGIEDANKNSFDVKIVSMAKKTYFQNIEFDDGKETERNLYHHFPAKFTIIEPQFEADDVESGVPKIKVTSPKKEKTVADKTGLPSKVLFPPEDLHLRWQHAKRVGAGLVNLGNTCFLNATLQCLTYTPPLFNYLMSGRHSTECRISGFCMTCELHRHVKSCFENGMSAIRPDSILRNLRVIARHMRWGRQEDAHEFLRYVIDAMLKSQLYGYEKLDPVSKETTVVHQIFGGYLRSQVLCMKCRYKSEKFDPFLDISIDLKNVGSVEMGLKRFIEPETLQGKNSYNCLRCKANVEARKCFTFHTTSNILTFQFKRYSMMGGKVTRHIAFSERLNMRPYMSDRHGDPITYHLYAVLVHEGSSTSSGHYYCYVRAPNHIWHCINDSHVRSVGVSQVLNAQAYLLFYVREKPALNSNQMSASKEKQNSVAQNGVTQHCKIKVETDGSSRTNASSEKPLVKPSVFPANGILEAGKKCNVSLKNEIHLETKHSEANSVLQNGAVRENMTTNTSGVVSKLEKIPHTKTNCHPQNGIASDGLTVRSSVCTENGVRALSDAKHLPNGVVNSKSLSKMIFKNGTVDNKMPSNSEQQKRLSSSSGCNGSFDKTISPKKKSSEANTSEDTLRVSRENISRISLEHKNMNGCGNDTKSSNDKSRFVMDQTHNNSLEKPALSSICNATTKWTVVAFVTSTALHEPTQLNATSQWTVTPLTTDCNGAMNADDTDMDSSSRFNSKEQHVDFSVGHEISNEGNARKKVLQNCEIQKWDQLLSSRYKNIRTDSDAHSRKISRTWDGARDRKDFLKDVSSMTLAYGAEVVTWDGEKSFLDRIIERENKQKKRNRVDEYNAELDKGRVKKFKKAKVDNFDGVNAFEELHRKSNQEKNPKFNHGHHTVRTSAVGSNVG